MRLKEKVSAELYRGLLHEALHKIDATLKPDDVEEKFRLEIQTLVRQWICATADDNMALASTLSAMFEELEKTDARQ